MTDIVERLLKADLEDAPAAIREAAVKIERLRNEVNRAAAEAERLWDRLRRVEEELMETDGYPNGDRRAIKEALNIIREAADD